MSIAKHGNRNYSGGYPLAVGDRYYSQDLFRDQNYLLDKTGNIIGDNANASKFLIYGGQVVQVSGQDKINLVAGCGYVAYTVTDPNSYAAIPPTTLTEDIDYIRVVWADVSAIDLATLTTPATLNGAATNYIKIRYKEADGSTRARAKKAGTYVYNQAPSYEFFCDTVIPTAYDLCIGTLVGAGSGAVMTIRQDPFDNVYIDELLNIVSYKKDNLLINGDFSIAQRGTSLATVNDDTYNLDRWIILSDSNGVVTVVQDATNTFRGKPSCRLTSNIANKKFGTIQIIENKNITPLRNREISASFWVQTTNGAKIDNIRAGLLSWTGTADMVTSDVVNAWGAVDVDPTLVASWAYLNTPVNILLRYTWQKVTIENIQVPVGITNLAIFIWTNDTTITSGDEFLIANVEINEGKKASEVYWRTLQEEMSLCQRYYCQFDFAGQAYLDGWTSNPDTTINVRHFHISECRATPTVIITGVWNANGNGGTRVITIGTSAATEFVRNMVCTRFTVVGGIGILESCAVIANGGSTLTSDCEL